MCTLVLAWNVFEDAPIAVAANRDEAIERPSTPPHVWETDPTIVAPRDDTAGGTWIGYNEHGVFAAITNRWLDDPPESERSRGLLVRDALGAETAEDATRLIERTVAHQSYDGFNLVIADKRAALYLEWDGSLSVTTLEPGVHVVVNVGADGRYRIPASRADAGRDQAENADALRTALQPEPAESGREWLDRAAETVSDHDFGVCVHGDEFGTRSSSLMLADDEPSYWFADGPPCETDYECVGDRV
ncbi:MAG: NRDE family protein [Halorhabdus sp.]